MSAWSIPPIAMASIVVYVGLYHLSIYVRRTRYREDLSFALMCLAAGAYCVLCAGLYNASSVPEGALWQRAQFIALPLFVSAFLWFAFEYTHQKPHAVAYAIWTYYLIAILVQAIDRTELTWIIDDASIKRLALPYGATITYYEATLGPFTQVQGLVGLLAGAVILWAGVSFYRQGHRKEATPLLVALALMYLAAISDTAIGNNIYPFIYTLEYAYLGMIVVMEGSLSGAVVNAAMTQEALQKSEERLKLALEAASDGVFDWNMQTGEVYFSPRYYTMLGYEPYEMPSSDATWLDLLHPDDKPFALKTVEEYTQARRQSHEIETRLRTKSGGWRWILSRAMVVGQDEPDGPVRMVGTHTDITERKHAEEALRQAKRIIEGSPAVLFRWKSEEGWPVEYVSDNVTHQFGYTPEEFLSGSLRFASIIHPDDRDRVAAEVQEFTRNNVDSFGQEYRIVAKNGETRWMDDRTTVHRDESGQVVRYEGLVIDITERKKTEDALHTSERMFRTLVESSPAGVFQVDDSYHYVYTNDELGRLLGYPTDAIIGMDFRDVLDDESRAFVADRYARRQRGETLPHRYEIGFVRKDGEKRRGNLIATAVKDARGKVITIGQLLDITEQKQAEDALRESREMLRLVLDSIPVRVFWKDKDSVYLGCNRAFATDAGLASPEEVIGKNDHMLSWAEQANLYRSDDRHVMETGTPKVGYEEPQSEPGGPLRWLRSSKVPLRDTQGNVAGVLGTYEDITEGKQLEQKLQMFRYSIDQASDAIFWHASDSSMTYVNEQACRSLGYTREELLGMHLWDIDPDFPKDRWDSEWELTQELGRDVAEHEFPLLETRHRRKDGSIFPVEAISKHLWFGDQQLHVAVVRDITERKKAEDALRRLSRDNEEALRIAHMGRWEYDVQTQLFTFNDQYYAMHGITREEAGGFQMSPEEFASRFVHPDDAHIVGEGVQMALETTDPDFQYQTEARVLKANGEMLYVSAWFRLEKDSQGRTTRILGVSQDVTEERQAEIALRQLSRENEEALQIAHMGRWEFDVPTRMFIFNDQYYTLHGTTAEEAGGYQISAEEFANKYTHPADAHRIAEGIQSAIETEDPDFQVQAELRVLRADGEMRYVRLWFRIEKDSQGHTTRFHGVSQDITEQKQAEETLKESEDRLLKAQAIAHVGSWEIDLVARTIWGSDEALRIYGVSPQDHVLPLKAIQERALPEHRSALDEAMRDLIAGKRPYAEDFQIKRMNDGEIRDVHSTAECVTDETGKPVRITGVVQDITQRKQMEHHLQMFQYSIDQASDAIFWHKKDSGLVYANEQACRSLGYTREELMQLHLGDWDSNYPREKWDEIWARTHEDQEGGEIQLESSHRRKDGSTFPVEVSSKHLWFGDTELHVAVVRDITERKQAEAALKETNELLTALINAAPTPILVMDLDGKVHKVWNPAAENMLGWSAEEVMGKRFPAIPPDQVKAFRQLREQIRSGRSLEGVEVRRQKRDGAPIEYNIYASPLHDAEGKVSGSVSVLVDVTERNRSAKALTESQAVLKATLESMQDGMLVVGEDGIISHHNSRFCEMWTIPEELVVSQKDDVLVDYVMPKLVDPEQFKARITETYQSSEASEDILQLKDGRLFERVSYPLIQQETHTGRVWVFRDITAHHKAEEALRESEFFLRKSQTVGRIGSYYFDGKTGNWKSSPMLDELFGIDDSFPKDVEGWISLVHPDEQEEMRDYLLQHVLVDHNRFDREYRIIRRSNQQELWVYGLGELEYDKENRPIKMIGTIQDITERKHAIKAIEVSEARFRALVENSPDFITFVDRDNRVKYVNRVDPQMTREEALGVNVLDYTVPEYRTTLENTISQTWDTGKPGQCEIQIYRGDRSISWMTIRVVPIFEEGKIANVMEVLTDTTERKQAEEALRESEARYRALVESQIDMISRYRPDSTLTFVNDAYCKFYGKTREELVGQSYLDMVAPEFREQTIKEAAGLVKNPRLLVGEYLNLDREGKERWIQWVIQCIADENGVVGELQAIGRDITRLKEAEQTLRQGEENYRDLYENAPNGYFSVNTEGLIGRCNKYLAGMLGYDTSDEIVGKPAEELFPDDARSGNNVKEVFRNVRAGESVHDEEIQMRKRDGTPIWVSLTANAERDDEGQHRWMRLMVVNITERRLAEEALRDSETRLSVIFNQSADLQAVSSVEPDGVFRIIAVNQRYVEASRQHKYDITEQDFVGKTLKELVTNVFKFDESVFEYTSRNYQKVVDTGQPFRYEEALDTPAGTFYGEVVLAPIFDATHTCRYILYSSRDITERRKADEEILRLNDELELRVMERTYQLEVTNRELESFAYSVSHDLRAPLRSIDGFSQALIEDYAGVLDEEGREHLQRVRAASQRMGQLIDDLLMLSRIARQEMRRETVDLSGIAREIMAELGQSDPERSVKIAIADDMKVAGDASLLRVVLSNLLANAWKFTSKKPQASIRFYETVTDGEHTFAVEDNGAGFDMKYADKLFGAFQRLHQKTDYEGTGIGLATVQRILHRHGGRIWAEAEVDRGATFYFTVSSA